MKLTIQSIANQCGVSRSTIKRWLKLPDAPDRKTDPEQALAFCLLLAGYTNRPGCKQIEGEIWGRLFDFTLEGTDPPPDEPDPVEVGVKREIDIIIRNNKFPLYMDKKTGEVLSEDGGS